MSWHKLVTQIEMVDHDPPHICPFKSTSPNWYAHQICLSTILSVNFPVQCQVVCLHPYLHLWFTIVNRINMLSVPTTDRPIRLPNEGHLRNNGTSVLVKMRKWIMMVLFCFLLMCLRKSHTSSMELMEFAFVGRSFVSILPTKIRSGLSFRFHLHLTVQRRLTTE